MSNRSLIELNHDYCPNDKQRDEWVRRMQWFMGSGDQKDLPVGVKFLGMRHHSDPEFLSELETLKAQLARAEFDLRRKDCSTCHGSGEFQDSTDGGIWVRCHCWANRVDEIKRVSEAQVRELRASLTLFRKLLWLRHGCGIAPLYGDDGEMQCAKCGIDFLRATPETISDIWKRLNEAALRSAPPSGQDESVSRQIDRTFGQRVEHAIDCTCDRCQREQAPFDKTDAWEERKDLARQGWDVDSATCPTCLHAVRFCVCGTSAGKRVSTSEQVPAVPDGFTHNREHSEVRVLATADKSVEYSGPQDSPSRSPKKSPRWAENRFGDLTVPCRGEEDCPHYRSFQEFGKTGRLHYHSPEKPAPPSPAREPEITQPTYEAPEIFRQRLRDSEKEKAE